MAQQSGRTLLKCLEEDKKMKSLIKEMRNDLHLTLSKQSHEDLQQDLLDPSDWDGDFQPGCRH